MNSIQLVKQGSTSEMLRMFKLLLLLLYGTSQLRLLPFAQTAREKQKSINQSIKQLAQCNICE